jgi:cobyrinic acid a,c-diamide synthase
MYLTRSIRWQGSTHEMVGALAADTVMHRKAVGRGYVELEATADHPWLAPGTRVRAHEFHHSGLENVAPDLRHAWTVRRGHGIDGARDGLIHRNVLAAYGHLRSVLGSDWPAHFVAFVDRCRAERLAATPALACG